MRYITANLISKQTDELYTKGIDTGAYVGFTNLSELYSCKLGCTTYITGIPSHGKTQFHFEVLMNLSEFYGWKHALFTPETGSPSEVIAELSHCYIQKPFIKHEGQMSQNEKYKADAFLSEYFYILTPSENLNTVEELLDICLEIKKEHGVQTFSIDPWNELNHSFEKKINREDKYLEYTLGLIRRFARENNIHIFIIAHPRTLRPLSGKLEPPNAFEISGGAAWYSKAESIICVHRPSNESNEVEIIIQKAKPKHIGKKGTANLFFDYYRNRYYEHLGGRSSYACKKSKNENIKMENNINFATETTDKAPF